MIGLIVRFIAIYRQSHFTRLPGGADGFHSPVAAGFANPQTPKKPALFEHTLAVIVEIAAFLLADHRIGRAYTILTQNPA